MSYENMIDKWNSLTGFEQDMLGFIGEDKLYKTNNRKEVECKCGNRIRLLRNKRINEKRIYHDKLEGGCDTKKMEEIYFANQCDLCERVYYRIVESQPRYL